MKISSQRLKEIIQEEIYNLEVNEVEVNEVGKVDTKQMAADKIKQVSTDIKELEPLLNKIVAMVDKAAGDAAKNDPAKKAEYEALIAQAIQGNQ